MEPAPWRCDICSALLQFPVWRYKVVGLESGEERWVTCDPCHDIIAGGKQVPLVIRAVNVRRENYVISRKDLVDLVVPKVMSFSEHAVGDPERLWTLT